MSTAETTGSEQSDLPVGTWTVDADQSDLGFRTRAMLGLMPVRGRFATYAGTLEVDADGGAHGELVVDAATIDTGIAKRDTHLRTADFFHIAEYPNVVFTLDTVRPDAAGGLSVTGSLKIRDKELPIVAPVRVTVSGERRLQLQGTFKVDHKAAGLGWSKPGMVQGHVRMDVSLVLSR